MKMLLSLIAALIGAYGLIVLLVFLMQSYLIYYPQSGREIVATPKTLGLNFELIEITTDDGERLNGWFVPADNANGTVLFLHGNAGNISHRLDYLPMFQTLGLNVLIFDYRGYGQSSGTPNEAGTYLDAKAAWSYLTEVKKISQQHIILYGESLGGAIAAWLATQSRPGMLILASTFTSIPDLAETIYPYLPVRWIARFEYNTLNYLKSVECPVFVAHSSEDEVVPFFHGQQLYQAAPQPKQFLTLSNGHNNGFIFMRAEWMNVLGAFIKGHLISTH